MAAKPERAGGAISAMGVERGRRVGGQGLKIGSVSASPIGKGRRLARSRRRFKTAGIDRMEASSVAGAAEFEWTVLNVEMLVAM